MNHLEPCPVFADPAAQCTCWNPWFGGVQPVTNDEPVEIWWANGISRIYPRGDYIMWCNLKANGTTRWRRPV